MKSIPHRENSWIFLGDFVMNLQGGEFLRQFCICLCGSVGKDFVYHACGHELESRLKWKFSNFPYHLWLLLSDYGVMSKWFGDHYNQEVHFSSAVNCKKWPQVLTCGCLIKDEIIIISLSLYSLLKISRI